MGFRSYAVGLQLSLSWPLQMRKGESDQYTGISDCFLSVLSNDLQNNSVAAPEMLNS